MSVLGSNLSVTAAYIVISILLSRILGRSGYGLYSSIIVIPTIVFGITQLGIRRATIFYLASKKYSMDDIVSSIVILFLFSSSLSVIISAVGFSFSESKNADPLVLATILMTIPLVLCNVLGGGIFFGRQQIMRANIINAGPTILNLFFIIVFVWVFRFSIRGAFFALFLGNLAMALYVVFTILKEYKITWKYHEAIMKGMVRVGIVFALSIFVMQLNYRFDIVLLKKLSTLEQIGLYTLAVQIAEQLWHIPGAIETIVLTRSAASEDAQASNRTVASIMRVSFLISIVFALMIYLLVPYVIPPVFGTEFSKSVPMMQAILPGILMLVVFRILNSRLAGMGMPQIAIYSFIPALIINLVLNLVWVPQYGGMGSVWATNISYVAGCIIFLFLYAWKVKMTVIEIFRFRKSDFYFFRNLINKIRWKLLN